MYFHSFTNGFQMTYNKRCILHISEIKKENVKYKSKDNNTITKYTNMGTVTDY